MKKWVIASLLIVILHNPLHTQTVSIDSFYAPSLGKFRRVAVMTPQPFDPAYRYPVLYLLHGYGGNHTDWTQRTKLSEYVKEIQLIIIMPDGENSWYVNSPTDTTMKYEDFLTQDLQTYVRNRYSIDTTKQAIAGLSMGGYGAIMLTLRHPDMFIFAGGLSSAITAPRDLQERQNSGWSKSILASLQQAFGNDISVANDRYSVFHLGSSHAPDSTHFFYVVHGYEDGFKAFLPAHREFADTLRAHRVRYEYREVPGGHSWIFWDREIVPLLARLRQAFGI